MKKLFLLMLGLTITMCVSCRNSYNHVTMMSTTSLGQFVTIEGDFDAQVIWYDDVYYQNSAYYSTGRVYSMFVYGNGTSYKQPISSSIATFYDPELTNELTMQIMYGPDLVLDLFCDGLYPSTNYVEALPYCDVFATTANGAYYEGGTFIPTSTGVITLYDDPLYNSYVRGSYSIVLEYVGSAVTYTTSTSYHTPTTTDMPSGTTVSFKDDVVPIFASAKCTDCHISTATDDVSGALWLDGDTATIYTAVQDIVDTKAPSSSLILTEPLATAQGGTEDHPSKPFNDPFNSDYQTILRWIIEGANNN